MNKLKKINKINEIKQNKWKRIYNMAVSAGGYPPAVRFKDGPRP